MIHIKQMAIAGVFFMAFPVGATTCADGAGLLGSGRISGTYCLANDITMNWWSAHSWCRAAGGHLANWNELCLGAAGPYCPNFGDSNLIANLREFVNDRALWLSVALANGKAISINSAGYRQDGLRSYAHVPICVLD